MLNDLGERVNMDYVEIAFERVLPLTIGTLALWKLVDIAIWFFSHIKIGWAA